jgi:hypothetical protein
MKSFADIRAEFAEQHPASVPVLQRIASPYPAWLRNVVLLMFIAAVLLSGVHTVPTIYATIPSSAIIPELVRQIAAYAAVVIVELGLFVSVYAAKSGSRNLALFIQIVAFTGAVAANIHSVIGTLESTDQGTLVVGAIIGVIAPIIAMLSSEVYIKMDGAERKLQQEADALYTTEQKRFDGDVLLVWDVYRREEEAKERKLSSARGRLSTRVSDVARTDTHADMSAGQDADGQADTRAARGHATGQGYTKNMAARDQMRAYLQTNNEARRKSSRWLADNVGLGGKTVWAEVLKEFPADIPPVVKDDSAPYSFVEASS